MAPGSTLMHHVHALERLTSAADCAIAGPANFGENAKAANIPIVAIRRRPVREDLHIHMNRRAHRPLSQNSDVTPIYRLWPSREIADRQLCPAPSDQYVAESRQSPAHLDLLSN